MRKLILVLALLSSMACVQSVYAGSSDELADLRASSSSASDSAHSSADSHTLMVVETDAGSASQSLNRIAGDIDPGWGVRSEDDEHFFKSDDHQAPSPTALEKKYNPDPFYQTDKNSQ